MTLRIRGGRVDAMQLESRLRELTGQAALVVGRLESTRDYSFTDVPEAVADALASRLEEGGDIAVATELPQEMFGGKQAQWKTNGSGGRGGGSSRGRGGSRGGYGGRPSYGDRDGGDRSSGSRYGNREDRFGGSSSRGGYGGGSRGGSSGYGGNSSYGRGGRDNDGF